MWPVILPRMAAREDERQIRTRATPVVQSRYPSIEQDGRAALSNADTADSLGTFVSRKGMAAMTIARAHRKGATVTTRDPMCEKSWWIPRRWTWTPCSAANGCWLHFGCSLAIPPATPAGYPAVGLATPGYPFGYPWLHRPCFLSAVLGCLFGYPAGYPNRRVFLAS